MTDYEGRIIEYIESDGLRLAFVSRQAKDKLQIIDERGRHDRVSLNHVVLVHEERATAGDFPGLVEGIKGRIEQVEEEIDIELLWETLQAESKEFAIKDLAESYFGTQEAVQQSALFRALFADSLHFKRKGIHFSPRPAKQVSEQLLALRRREEKEALRQQSLLWVQQVLTTDEEIEIPQEMNSLLQRAEDFLLRKKSNDVAELLGQASDKLTAQEVAFEVLVRTGRLDPDADPFLVMAGIEERIPRKVLEQAERLAPFQANGGRRDYTSLVAFSIDDEETREVDDALTVEDRGDGLRVGIHIADVAHFVPKDDPLDEQAFRRSVSVYLPARTVPMFPERLSHDLASLNQDEWRPTMSFEVDLDESAHVLDWRLHRGQICVVRRLSYTEADRMIQSSEPDELARCLQKLYTIAQHLTEQRIAQGALVIRRPELKVRIHNGQINVKVIDPRSPSRHLISEFMILANRLAAQHAVREAVPVIFRTQDPPVNALSQGAELEYDPVELNRVLKGLRRSRLSLSPQLHAGLGLDAYTQLTSPIRRFADVVIQRQMAAHLAGEPPPYEREELMQVLGAAEAAEREVRAIERQATRFWTLKYLATLRADEPLEAIVVEKSGGGYLLELCDYFTRGYLSTTVSHDIGAHLHVAIERIDPKRDILRFIEVV